MDYLYHEAPFLYRQIEEKNKSSNVCSKNYCILLTNRI